LNAFYICCTQGSIKNNVPSNTPDAAVVVVVSAAAGCISLLHRLVFFVYFRVYLLMQNKSIKIKINNNNSRKKN
jgi:hypothetical protein